ncbi:multisubunit sodium/proton antiporter, MrpE subunit [Desulfatibacillum alkenivorans DSM 16219]|jgi:multicomponent Na+:H+ antiporter subunit E|uniref:Multisubunit sodium/proton antiporter, MrpE subunit n=1 Tax=Desulfatibacillum alkenivorans DSM 16219 TaxID=1121393 RepID=A0A1M6QRP2_9BACT|nr:Na+/H+ antiporter subunit E [Desulfatibacillum alkenivorans]SHK22763.1 multisubunit sodium/proton antiporter, MrpE subunit [Desulfatibacillum alkenivorans DSM 16219]
MKPIDLEELSTNRREILQATQPPPKNPYVQKGLSLGISFLLLFGAWVLLSGKFDAFHLSLGAASSLFVAWISRDLLFPSGDVATLARSMAGVAAYTPWLLLQIVKSNIHVLRIAFARNPERLIHPHIISMHTKLKGEIPLVTFANSITLTPGTITIQVSAGNEVRIHALDYTTGDMDALREMESRVARAFGESD